MDEEGVLSLEEILKDLLPILGPVVACHISLSELMQADQQLRLWLCKDVAFYHHSVANERKPLHSFDLRSF